jgi:signal transduction histidine kinase
VGAALGVYASRRMLRPLREFSSASEALGTGQFDTRLSSRKDPDLAPLAAAFNEMAEALEHRIERDARFASDVSHELRNPLTALSAAVDVLEARADERTQPAIDVLRAQVNHFRRLLLDLLELSRFDSGRAELVLSDVNVRACVAATVEEVTGNGAEIVVADDVPARLSLDERRFERALANLLDNAERHGGGATRVEVSEADGFVQVAVEDAGPGVPEHERALVFDRFHRGPRRDQAAGGSGLGLAIVAEHCHAHGGYARVEQRPQGGARFVAVFREGEAA